MATARRGILPAWKAIRSGHKKAVRRIVSEVKAGNLEPEVGSIDIQGVTEQAARGSRPDALCSHGMISEETRDSLPKEE